jgi:hypothetical protein
MRMTRLFSACCLVVLLAAPSSAASLKLSIQNGLVSLDAQDVTVRQILAEWGRVGRTQVVNAERIMGGPVTLKFDAVPEKQALDIVLRSVPGYVAAHREALVADASMYERILIMPTTTSVAAVRQQPQQPYPGFPGGFPGLQGGANVTQLRPGPPGALPDVPDPSEDQMHDPALAAAAAAGLVPVPALSPGPSPVLTPMMPNDRMQGPLGQMMPPTTAPPNAAPSSTTPANPRTGQTGTPQPTLAPPPPPTPQPPVARPQPPQADR